MTAEWLVWLTIAAVLFLLIRQTDARVVFLASGLGLFTINGNFLSGADAFAQALVNPPLLIAVCSSLGFAHVVSVSGCDKELVSLLTQPFSKAGFFILPLVVLISFGINISMPSSTAVVAALGASVTPLLVKCGFSPVSVASSILVGTFGSALNPGFGQNAYAAFITGSSEIEIIGNLCASTLYALAIVTSTFSICCWLFHDFKRTKAVFPRNRDKIRLHIALAPLVPVTFFLISIYVFPSWNIGVAQAMLLGVIYIAVMKPSAGLPTLVRAFFDGMGFAYSNIYGITISAAVFAMALVDIGFINNCLESMGHDAAFLKYSSALIAFGVSALAGSSDAISFAINQILSPAAENFGLDQISLCTLVSQSGQLGRLLSPFSGAALLLCQLAGIHPVSLLKRTALPLISAEIFLLVFR